MERPGPTPEKRNGKSPVPYLIYQGGYQDPSRPFIVSVDAKILGEALSDFGLTDEQIEKLNVAISPDVATVRRIKREHGRRHIYMQPQPASLSRRSRSGKRTLFLYMGHHYASYIETKTSALEYVHLSKVKNPEQEILFWLNNVLPQANPKTHNAEKLGKYLKDIGPQQVAQFIDEMNKRRIKQALIRSTLHYTQHLKDFDANSKKLLPRLQPVVSWSTLFSAGWNAADIAQSGLPHTVSSDIPGLLTVTGVAAWVALRKRGKDIERTQEANAKAAELPMPPKFKEAFNVSVNPEFDINTLSNPTP